MKVCMWCRGWLPWTQKKFCSGACAVRYWQANPTDDGTTPAHEGGDDA